MAWGGGGGLRGQAVGAVAFLPPCRAQGWESSPQAGAQCCYPRLPQIGPHSPSLRFSFYPSFRDSSLRLSLFAVSASLFSPFLVLDRLYPQLRYILARNTQEGLSKDFFNGSSEFDFSLPWSFSIRVLKNGDK